VKKLFLCYWGRRFFSSKKFECWRKMTVGVAFKFPWKNFDLKFLPIFLEIFTKIYSHKKSSQCSQRHWKFSSKLPEEKKIENFWRNFGKVLDININNANSLYRIDLFTVKMFINSNNECRLSKILSRYIFMMHDFGCLREFNGRLSGCPEFVRRFMISFELFEEKNEIIGVSKS